MKNQYILNWSNVSKCWLLNSFFLNCIREVSEEPHIICTVQLTNLSYKSLKRFVVFLHRFGFTCQQSLSKWVYELNKTDLLSKLRPSVQKLIHDNFLRNNQETGADPAFWLTDAIAWTTLHIPYTGIFDLTKVEYAIFQYIRPHQGRISHIPGNLTSPYCCIFDLGSVEYTGIWNIRP